MFRLPLAHCLCPCFLDSAKGRFGCRHGLGRAAQSPRVQQEILMVVLEERFWRNGFQTCHNGFPRAPKPMSKRSVLARASSDLSRTSLKGLGLSFANATAFQHRDNLSGSWGGNLSRLHFCSLAKHMSARRNTSSLQGWVTT